MLSWYKTVGAGLIKVSLEDRAKCRCCSNFFIVNWLTHSVLWNKALVPCECAHAALRRRPSFHEPYFCCLGKLSQAETSFKMNSHLMKGESSITSYCIVLTFKSVKIWWLVKEILVFFLALDVYFFMADDSEEKVDDLDDAWVLDP